MTAKNAISRRRLLRQAAVAGAGAFAVACAQPKPTVAPTAATTPAAGETAAPTTVPPTAATEPVTLSIIVGPEEGFGEITPDDLPYKYLAEQFGVKFEISQVPWGTLGQQLSLRIASGDLPTLMILERAGETGLSAFAFASKYGAEGLFVKLDEYINAGKMPNLKAFMDKYRSISALATAGDGRIYAVPKALVGDWSTGLGLRPDLLEQAGYFEDRKNPPPSREFMKTPDELFEVLKDLKEQLGGQPVLGARGLEKFYERWCFFFGTSLGPYFNPATKQYECGPLMKRYRVMVEFVNRIYA
ncbi:MAG: extracellular solute-binding protein, partial [Anaerolineae bacterium]|nr:extracellular solute-binding protein [Anaerolineae bacterium]